MTYCLGIVTKHGLVMASDSRSNAGFDQVNVCRKMHCFEKPGDRVFVLLASGSLSCTQSVITLLRREFDAAAGLATVTNMYDAARVVGEVMREVAKLDREALEKDDFKFNVHILIGGQVKGEKPGLYMVYPQGNPLSVTEETPYLQIGEVKYGRPILDRGIRHDKTTLEEAAKYALLSLDSTMRSNVTVGPPIDLIAYSPDELEITKRRKFTADDPDLQRIRARWDQGLRQAVAKLPQLRFRVKPGSIDDEQSIQFIEATSATPADVQASASAPGDVKKKL